MLFLPVTTSFLFRIWDKFQGEFRQLSYSFSIRISQYEDGFTGGRMTGLSSRISGFCFALFESAFYLYLDNTFLSSDEWNLVFNGRVLKWNVLEDMLKCLVFYKNLVYKNLALYIVCKFSLISIPLFM